MIDVVYTACLIVTNVVGCTLRVELFLNFATAGISRSSLFSQLFVSTDR